MNEKDNQTFVIDMNDKTMQLSGLANTAKLLAMDYLNSWLSGFIEMEKYEEAAVIKKELDGRFRYYLTDMEGKVIPIAPPLNQFEL